MGKVLGIGNALLDRLVQIGSGKLLGELGLPKGGMELINTARYRRLQSVLDAYSTIRTTGGSACNTMKVIARLGGEAGLIGKVGADEEGRFFEESFARLGVETHLITDSLPTGVASTFITSDGQRTFGTYLGAAARLTADELQEEWFEGCEYFYIEGYLVQDHALVRRATQMAHAAGAQVCLDLASFNIVEKERDFFTGLMPEIDIVFANEYEACAFTGMDDAQANLAHLADLCETAVVKIGKHGVLAKRGTEEISCPARDVPRVVDTTAAGDYFSAGFLYARQSGRSLMECVELGSLLAGHIIEVVGTSLPDTVWNRLCRYALMQGHK